MLEPIDYSKLGKKERERLLRRMPLPKPLFYLKYPVDHRNWELVASTKDDFEQFEEKILGQDGNDQLQDLVHSVCERLSALQQDRERIIRATSRLRSNLTSSASPVEALPQITSSGRRVRKPINYRYDDYDDMMKTAINGKLNAKSNAPKLEAEVQQRETLDRGARLLKRLKRIEGSVQTTPPGPNSSTGTPDVDLGHGRLDTN